MHSAVVNLSEQHAHLGSPSAMKLILACMLVMLLSAIPSLAAEKESNWVISAKPLQLKPGERISAFSLNLKAASIKTIREIPSMWSISLDNFQFTKAPWATSVTGRARNGVAYLEPLYFEQDFINIRKHDADLHFDAQLKLSVAGTDLKTRSVTLTAKDLIIKPMTD